MLANVFETATKPARFVHFRQGAQSLAPTTQNGIPSVLLGKMTMNPEILGLLNFRQAN
jgi:hypothetical protein